nr:phospholipase/carboxylesterase [uncultured bacterium]
MDAKVIDSKPLQYVLVTPDGFIADGSYPLVVMMHGFGANMYDLANLSPNIDPEGYVYAFPNAPFSLQGTGGQGFSWMLGRPGVVEPAGPGATVDEMLESFLAEVMQSTGARPGNIVLGGFSQGAGLALSHGLLRSDSYRALMVLSGFFRSAEEVRPRLPAQRSQPIFLVHGRQDTVIPLEQAHETKRFLEDAGYSVEYHEYDMAHSISGDVIADLVPWLHTNLPPKS